MSRVGKKPIEIPKGVEVNIADSPAGQKVTVKGKNGTLERVFRPSINISMEDGIVNVERTSELKQVKQLHGTTRAHIANMVEGVSNGFTKVLMITGVGYKANAQGNKLVLNLGYSHPIELSVPEGLKCETPKENRIEVSGADKEKVGAFARDIRQFRTPDPYKAKGVKYKDEFVRRKSGKSMTSGD